MDSNRLGAWRLFLASHSAVLKELERELVQEADLPLGWYEVLYRLRHADGRRLRMQDLADSVLLTPSGLTRLVDRMEEAGLVRREQCPGDRRGSYAVLTARGRNRLAKAAPVHLRGVERHFARHLTDHEAAVMEKALGRILEALRRPP